MWHSHLPQYGISRQIGERVLLPAVRAAAQDTLIIADGFSCFQQIQGLTGRTPLHIAEVLQMAIRQEPAGGGAVEEQVGQSAV